MQNKQTANKFQKLSSLIISHIQIFSVTRLALLMHFLKLKSHGCDLSGWDKKDVKWSISCILSRGKEKKKKKKTLQGLL